MKAKHLFILMATLLSLMLYTTPYALAQGTELEIEVTQQSYLIFNGDRLTVTVNLSNVGDSSVQGVTIHSSNGDTRAVGTLAAGTAQDITFYVETYVLGKNQVEIYATYTGGETAHRSIWFEVRPPNESVTLRVVNAPQAIYEGGNYTAQLQVQNLWQNAVSGVLIKNGDAVLYYVGALNPNQSLNFNLRVPNYEIGNNSLQLVVEDERGSAPPVPLAFEVIPADTAVKVYLASLSPATYPAETLKFSLVIAASEVAGVSDLEIKSLTDGVQPAGYFLGEQTAQQQQLPEINVQSLLSGQSQTQEQQEPQNAVRGKELAFQVQDPIVGTQPLSFQVSYRIGSVSIQKTFTVDALVIGSPSMQLIQAQRIEATKGEEALVVLHVANDLPVEADAVTVVPVGDFEASPAEFFIGTMAPNDFLPANFKVETNNLKDGEQLSFKLTYRIGTQNYETQPIQAVIHLQNPQKTNLALYIVPPVAVVLLVLVWWSLRRRRWTR
jgi:hypothetical protein